MTKTVLLSRSLVLASFLGLGMLASGCSLFRNRTAEEDSRLQAQQLANRGTEFLQRGELEQAGKLFAEATRIVPDHERGHAEYARVLWKQGQQDDAIEHMKRAARLSGDDADYQIELGQMELERGDLEQALANAEAAVKSDHESTEAFALRGKIRDWQGDSELALADYLQVLGQQPEHPEVQLATARIYLQRRRAQRALAILSRTPGQCSETYQPAAVARLRAQALKQLGRPDDAVQLLLNAIRGGATDADVYYELAEAQWFSGQPENAQLALRQALEINPDHPASLKLKTLMANSP